GGVEVRRGSGLLLHGGGGAARTKRILLERVVELAGILEALVLPRLHGLEDDGLELLVDLRPEGGRQLLLAAVDGVDELRQRAAVERQRAREHLVEDDAG